MKNVFVTFVFVFALAMPNIGVSPVFAGDYDLFGRDFEAAKNQAKLQGRYIYALFSGTDWCGYCIKLKNEILVQDGFKQFAADNMVLFLADSPHYTTLPQEEQNQNTALNSTYGISGYPTVLLISPDGTEMKRYVGYGSVTVEYYIQRLQTAIASFPSLVAIDGQVATPIITPAGGSFTTSQSVTLNCSTAGATIRYTTDGSTPSTTSGTLHSGPVTLLSSVTLKVIAFKTGMADSEIASATFTKLEMVATPTIAPAGGAFTTAQSVTLNCATSGAIIRYTTDGSPPSATSGTLYSGAFELSSSATVKVIACKDRMLDSDVTSAVFTKLVGDQMTIPLKAGFNFVGFCSNVSSVVDSAFLLEGNPSLSGLFKFDTEDQSFKFQLKLVDGNLFGSSFGLVPGRGYVFQCSTDATLAYIGQEYTEGTLPLVSGFNLIALPSQVGAKASSLLDGDPTLDAVYFWDVSSQRFMFLMRHGESTFGDDFTITAGVAYIIRKK